MHGLAVHGRNPPSAENRYRIEENLLESLLSAVTNF